MVLPETVKVPVPPGGGDLGLSIGPATQTRPLRCRQLRCSPIDPS